MGGPECVAGILMGTIISGIQLAISMANSGGAWDNCKKSIKNNGLRVKYSEYYSSKAELLNDELTRIQENIALLQRHGVYNLSELVSREANLKRQIEDIDNERKVFADEVIKDKKNPFYFRAESASISGDTVGDPLKDTSGPSLNILIKLSSILSVVFATYFKNTNFFGPVSKAPVQAPK